MKPLPKMSIYLNFILSSSIFCLLLLQSAAWAKTWQEQLQEHFDIVDTFDNYSDWTGTTSASGNPFVTNPSDLPRYTGGSPSNIWKRYAYSPDGETTGEGRRGPWIGNHGPGLQVGTKGLKLSARGFGPLEMNAYLGNGSSSSGYSEIYLFFRAYFPNNAFPTHTQSCTSNGLVGFDQSIYNSHGYMWLTGLKFVNFGTGFTSVDTHPDDSICEYYGDGEAWIELSNIVNDGGQHPIFWGQACHISHKDVCAGDSPSECDVPRNIANPTIGFDELGAIEIRLKQETYSRGTLSQYGEIEVWWYNSNGTPWRIFYSNKVQLMEPSDSGHLINRVIINGNKHRYESGDDTNLPAAQKCSVGEYKLGNGMASSWHLDDFIVPSQRVGSTCFQLLNPGSPDATSPAAPTGLRVR